jgi:UDP-GlcNAc:undecaprenyl-phosphate GlcNAc-1-phosphate transferase
VTEPHRGHLYQVAQRAGMDARHVAILHWSFACMGGLACIGFSLVPSDMKPLIPVLLLVPQLVWLGYVVARARQAHIGRW